MARMSSILGVIEPDDDKKFGEIATDMTQASVILNDKGRRIRPR